MLLVSSRSSAPAVLQVCADAAEQARVGAPEAVDRLLRIADHEQLAGRGRRLAPVALGGVGRGEQQEDLGLQRVGVLELVDEDALVEPLQIGARARRGAAGRARQQQVHEVELPGALLLRR